jgi:RHS repeat-associated protein
MISSPLYTEELYYDDALPVFEGISPQASFCHNGNINALKHSYHFADLINDPGNFNQPTLYGHSYDKANRLIAADAIVGDHVAGLPSTAIEQQIGDVEFSYDVIGNILNNYRYVTMDDDGTIVPDLKAMTYSYPDANNLLAEVSSNSSDDQRIFTYDAKGNMMTDAERGLLHVQYDQANMPTSLSLDPSDYGVDEGVNMDYFYTSAGQRFAKQLSYDDEVQETEYYFSDATGAMQGIRKTALNDNDTWELYVNGTGREAKINSLPNSDVMLWGSPDFYLKDHLGNTRVVASGGCGPDGLSIEQAVDYYPYGKVLRQYANGEVERFLSTEHERDSETGYDYRGARFYDADLARFLSTDPLAADYPNLSPYAYVANNPIMYIDPDGRKILPHNKKADDAVARLAYRYGAILKVGDPADDGGVYSTGEYYTSSNNLRKRAKNQYGVRLSKSEAAEAYAFYQALEGDVVEVSVVLPSEGGGDFTFGDSNAGQDGSRTGGGGLITNNSEFNKFTDMINSLSGGAVTPEMMEVLFSGESVDVDGNTYSITPNESGDGYSFFINEDEHTQRQSKGHLLIDGSSSSERGLEQQIIQGVNEVK